VNRRNLLGLIAGLAVLGRTKPSESKQATVLPPEAAPNGRQYFAVSDWGRDKDIAVTCVYWRDEHGDYYIQDMHECTAQQVMDHRCPCTRFIPQHAHDEDLMGHFLDAGGDLERDRLVLPCKVPAQPVIKALPYKRPSPVLFELLDSIKKLSAGL
jgi:hypothetical protein